MSVEKKLWYSPVPLALAFEPINLCNARCFCCPYTEFADDKSFITQKMSKEQIKVLIEDWVSELDKYNIKHKKVFYMMSYPNRSHGIREDDAYPHVRLMFTDFLRKYCEPGGKLMD